MKEAVQNIQLKSVNSSNIKMMGHDKATNTLEVLFYSGKSYQYQPVTEDAYHTMLKADSIGSYFSKNIRSNKLITCLEIEEKK